MRCRRAREEALEQGIEQGIEQGMDRLGTLVGLLLDAGRLDDARRVSEDAAYRDEMLAEFGLKASEWTAGKASRRVALRCECYRPGMKLSP